MLLHSSLQPFFLLNNTAHHRDLRHVTSILEGYYDIDLRPRKKSQDRRASRLLAFLARREKRPWTDQ